MEITEKELLKLKQLDRIEYRQRYKLLKEEIPAIGLVSFVKEMGYLIFIIMGFSTLFLIGGYKEQALGLSLAIPILIKITVVSIPLIFLFWAILYSRCKKQIDSFKNEYFEEKLEVKK